MPVLPEEVRRRRLMRSIRPKHAKHVRTPDTPSRQTEARVAANRWLRFAEGWIGGLGTGSTSV